MSDFGKALITFGFNARTTSLKMWVDYKIHSTKSKETGALIFFLMYEIPNILR